MKLSRAIPAILVALFAGGCITSTAVRTNLDLSSPWRIAVLHGEEVLRPDAGSEQEIEAILKNWLPRLRTTISTYPTPLYRLHVDGRSDAGDPIEEIIFVGSNWIGDGRGIATLADTQSFRLTRAIEEIIANQAEHSTPRGWRLSP